jgi:ABC-type cobalt transport system substrate-binding protein
LSKKGRKPGLTLAAIGLCIIVSALILPYLGAAAAESHGEGKWQGVDEAVVEKISREHHREARAPLIDMGQGDLFLFAFLAAGAIGGFVAGYYWRKLTEQRGH